MRNKKIFSTVVATVLATTMAMPVMAADGGDLPVDVTTKTAVIRVEVPTKLEISVNQFEMGDEGSQIYSGDFTMDNKSEIPVKVNVTSTADLKASTKLVATKAGAEGSTTAGEAWVAVAAKTGANSYADGTATAAKELTEGNRNVETFVQGTDANATKGTAEQTFYLNKSSGVMEYKLLNANEDASGIEYAKFYELTEETVGDDDDLRALLAENDVYVATAAAANGQALTKVAKGGAHTYEATEVYYTADLSNAVEKADIVASKLYVYGDGTPDATTDSGSAAFRYIGKLSGEQEKWDDTDITTVTIKYDIVGVTETKYGDVKTNCVYGLYKDPTPPAPVAGLAYTSGKDNTDVVLQFTPPAGKTMATNFIKVNGVDASAWGSFGTSFEWNTTANTVTVKSAVFGFGSITGATTDHKYTFTVKDSDGTEYSTSELDLTP